MIEVPAGWSTYGSLPSQLEAEALGEDLLQIRTPGDVYTIDVGWLPELDLEGEFVCVMVEDGDWEHPLAGLSTRSLSDVEQWVHEQVEECSQRLKRENE